MAAPVSSECRDPSSRGKTVGLISRAGQRGPGTRAFSQGTGLGKVEKPSDDLPGASGCWDKKAVAAEGQVSIAFQAPGPVPETVRGFWAAWAVTLT